jgi:hypothetical protein
MKNNLIYVEIVKINNTIHNTQKTPPPQTWFYATTMAFALNGMETLQNGVHTVGG